MLILDCSLIGYYDYIELYLILIIYLSSFLSCYFWFTECRYVIVDVDVVDDDDTVNIDDISDHHIHNYWMDMYTHIHSQ